MGGEMSRIMHQPREDDTEVSALLSTLRDARPAPEVERRIVERSLARLGSRSFEWMRAAVLPLAGAAAAVAIGVGLHVYQPVVPGSAAIAKGGSLRSTQEGPTSFHVGRHQILLSPSSLVKVDAAEPGLTELVVEAGTATFDVEKLQKGEAFRVRTDQVLVEVVGTRFSVGAQGSCSLIRVEEGIVRVTSWDGRVEKLEAGRRGRYCAGQSSDALLREALVLISGGQSLPKAAELLESYLATGKDPALEEEALFHLCILRARLGEKEEARSLAEDFRSRFPMSARIQRLDQWLDEG